MRSNQASLTAIGIALMRAIESEKPAGERICFDPYARQFIPRWMYTLFGFFIRSGYAEWRGPGVNGYLAARERYIDDALQKYLDLGLDQLVLLGAGYDSRAYRFHFSPGTQIFEVDHPATQDDKLAKLNSIFRKVPEQVIFVPIDFNSQSLETCLIDAGYDQRKKTLVIWQGVTMYLTLEAVKTTLEFFARHCAAGSAVLFDYVDQAALDGNQKHNEITNMRRYRFMSGENITFGIPSVELEAFLVERGFHQVQNILSQDLKPIYFKGKNASRSVTAGYGIATGIV